MDFRPFSGFGRRTTTPRSLVATCLLLAACAPTGARFVDAAPAAPPVARAPAAAAVATPPAATTKRGRPEADDRACAALRSGASTTPQRIEASPSPVLAEAPALGPPPSPKADDAEQKTPPAGAKPSAADPVNLAERIRDRSAEIAGTAAVDADAAKTADLDAEAAKAAASGRTALAAELYAAAWRATPTDWDAAFRAVELWSRIGDDVRAEALLKAVEASAASTKNDAVVQRAHGLDDKLAILGGATNQAARLWRRTFALEAEGDYAEAAAVLRRLQEFDPTAPGYYVREASLYARCEDALRAGDAIARGSAAGVAYTGRWAPAHDPALVRLWRAPEFAQAIRDTLGDPGVEEFEAPATSATISAVQ